MVPERHPDGRTGRTRKGGVEVSHEELEGLLVMRDLWYAAQWDNQPAAWRYMKHMEEDPYWEPIRVPSRGFEPRSSEPKSDVLPLDEEGN